MLKFKEQRDFDDELGAVEFSCRRLPVATVFGHWSQVLFFGLFAGGFCALMLGGALGALNLLPEKQADRWWVLAMMAIPLSIAAFALGLWWHNHLWGKLHLDIHRNGLRWNRVSIRNEEVLRLLPGAAPGAVSNSLPTLSRMFRLISAITNPITYHQIQQVERASMTVKLESGGQVVLRNVHNMFSAEDIQQWLQRLSNQRPQWFRSEDWT